MTIEATPGNVPFSDLLGNEFGWLAARIDAEMAEYWGGAYIDSSCAKDQLQQFAAEVMAPLQARIRELTLYAAQVEAERDDALADALRAYTKLNGLHVSARAHRDRVRALEAELATAKAEAETAYGGCGPIGKCQACGREHEAQRPEISICTRMDLTEAQLEQLRTTMVVTKA